MLPAVKVEQLCDAASRMISRLGPLQLRIKRINGCQITVNANRFLVAKHSASSLLRPEIRRRRSRSDANSCSLRSRLKIEAPTTVSFGPDIPGINNRFRDDWHLNR